MFVAGGGSVFAKRCGVVFPQPRQVCYRVVLAFGVLLGKAWRASTPELFKL